MTINGASTVKRTIANFDHKKNKGPKKIVKGTTDIVLILV